MNRKRWLTVAAALAGSLLLYAVLGFDAHPVTDGELTALATRRGDAIAAGLQAAGKVDPARFKTAPPSALDGSGGRLVAGRSN